MSIDDNLCLWYDVVKKGTTGQDVMDELHPLYKCKICNDPYNINLNCLSYRSMKSYRYKKDKYQEVKYGIKKCK